MPSNLAPPIATNSVDGSREAFKRELQENFSRLVQLSGNQDALEIVGSKTIKNLWHLNQARNGMEIGRAGREVMLSETLSVKIKGCPDNF